MLVALRVIVAYRSNLQSSAKFRVKCVLKQNNSDEPNISWKYKFGPWETGVKKLLLSTLYSSLISQAELS